MSASPRVIDAREMAPPEPMEVTLAALKSLPPGEELILLIQCQPHPLYQVLQGKGYVWTEQWDDEGTNTIRIRSE